MTCKPPSRLRVFLSELRALPVAGDFLTARRVIVTRPAAQAPAWVAGLRERGLNALSLPLIDIAPVPDPAPLRQAWASLPEYDAVMFVSANAVGAFFDARPAGAPDCLAGAKATPRAWSTGPGTRAELLKCGVESALIDSPLPDSPSFDSEALWLRVSEQVRTGFRCLIVRGGRAEPGLHMTPGPAKASGAGRDWLADCIHSAGGVVDWVVSYERRPPVLGMNAGALLQVAARDGSVWLFSSSEAIDNLRSVAGAQDWSAAIAVVTHHRIGEAARRAGFGVVCESRPDMASLMASIESLP